MTGSLRLIASEELSGDTAQTGGLRRSAAISGAQVGAAPEFAFREHHEENPSAGTEAVLVATRPAQEAIVVNLPGL